MAALPVPPPPSTVSIDGPTLSTLIPPSVLIPHLLSALPSLSPSIRSPPRLSYQLSPPSPSSLLLMPCWSLSPSLPYIGVKILTSFPLLSPSIHASYSLLSSLHGSPLASLDGTLLTLLRTSSLSAAASSLLSLPRPSTLLLAGAGSLAPHLISAHRAARPSLRRFLLWNRSPHKSISLASQLQDAGGDDPATYEHTDDIDSAVAVADIIVCATSSERPIVKGELMKEGAHLNLVGSFRRDMRECDDEAVRRGRVFVDVEAAAEEAGEIVGAIERGVIGREDVVGTLAELAGGAVVGRRREDEITVFKSVGSAEFDLLAAQLAYESYLSANENF